MNFSGNLHHLKKFVKGTDNDEGEASNHEATRTESCGIFDARKTYEEIIGGELKTEQQIKESHVTLEYHQISLQPPPVEAFLARPTSSHSSTKPPTLSLLMKHAELNDCERLMEGLEQDPSLIDSVDQFGWSLLMVAACAGALQVVQLLLDSGANRRLRDKAGNSCISLARKNGHLKVVENILKFSPVTAGHDSDTSAQETPPFKVELCPACNISVIQSQKKSHLTSTVHQLSQCSKGCKTYYSISGSNRGYQLMLKNGWDGEKGLGPSGSGLKFPPKTTLKRDRKGLGLSKGIARITHFRSNDIKAVAEKPVPLRHDNKKKLNQRLYREKLIEMSLRRDLS